VNRFSFKKIEKNGREAPITFPPSERCGCKFTQASAEEQKKIYAKKKKNAQYPQETVSIKKNSVFDHRWKKNLITVKKA